MSAGSRDDLLERLTEGIRRLCASDLWTDWLRVQSRFHRYSFLNALAIQIQRPDATRVAGFNSWRSLGRFVQRGSRGIAILAPVVRRTRVTDDESGEETTIVSAPSAFRVVHVFDVADTSGTDLPPAPCSTLTGAAPQGLLERLMAIGRDRGYTVELSPMEDSRANGDINYRERRIRVRADLAPGQQAKTMSHELGHALLEDEAIADRPLAELMAESVAFIVCAACGIDSSDYSLGYVTTWAGGGDEAIAAIKAVGSRIQRAANELLGLLERAGVVAVSAA